MGDISHPCHGKEGSTEVHKPKVPQLLLYIVEIKQNKTKTKTPKLLLS